MREKTEKKGSYMNLSIKFSGTSGLWTIIMYYHLFTKR